MKNIRKYLSVILTVVMIVSMFSMVDFSVFSVGTVWDGSVAESFNSGNGTQEDPYIIKTAEELAYLSQQVNGGYGYENCYFELGADIILNDTTNWENWGTYNEAEQLIAPVNTWTPIGKYSNLSFNGYFDGKGYTVKGVYINNVTAKFFGLFGYAGEPDSWGYSERKTIKNLNVECSYIYGENKADDWTPNIGGIVGYGNAENCTFNGEVVGEVNDDSYAGGIVGYGNAENCVNYGEISGFAEYSYVGGIIGSGSAENCINNGKVTGGQVGGITGSGSADGCVNNGTLYGYSNVGGISAYGIVTYSYNNGDIYAYNCDVGGVVCDSYSYSPEEITKYCYNSGDIYFEGNYNYVGGVVSNGVAIYCYNSGDINISSEYENHIYIGGIIGQLEVNYEIDSFNCYNAGEIFTDNIQNIGGAISDNFNDKIVNDCYYLENDNYSDSYAISLSSEDMKKASSYVNWNFYRVWEFIDGAEYKYPTLRCFGSKEYCYAVDFYDGDTLSEQKLVSENTSVTLNKLPNKNNAVFYGWQSGGTMYFPNDQITVTNDMSLTAVWQIINTDSKSWDGTVDTEWQGSGSEDDPYLITNAAELAGLGYVVNNGNNLVYTYFSLTNDIYLNDISGSYDYYHIAENNWTPIGSGEDEHGSNNRFCGRFNGNGHTIYGLYMKTSYKYAGLFGYVTNGSIISNVKISDSHLFVSLIKENSDNNYVGLLAGYADSPISDCEVSGRVQVVACEYLEEDSYGDIKVGGIVGYSNDITDCINNSNVSITSNIGNIGMPYLDMHIGGISGFSRDIANCTNYGDISMFDFRALNSSDIYFGGVSGYSEDITGCTNYGEISSNLYYITDYGSDSACIAGVCAVVNTKASDLINYGKVTGFSIAAGVVAKNWNSDLTVENCVNNGNVSGSHVGGVFGKLHNGKSHINNSHNNGDLTVTTFSDNYESYIGGIMAFGTDAVDCTNSGKIHVNNFVDNDFICYVGGIFGHLDSVYYEEEKTGVLRCENFGDIIVDSFDRGCIGGIGGYTNNYNEVSCCYNEGNISVGDMTSDYSSYEDCVGGILGKGIVKDSYNIGSVTVGEVDPDDDTDVYIGGIVGKGTLENSYNIGNIILNDVNENRYDVNIGGAIGFSDTDIVSSFYLNTCITDSNANDLAQAVSSANLSKKSTFEGWDFNKNWEFGGVSGYSYPNLRFMGSKNFNYYLQFVDGDNVISKQLLKGGTSIDFSAPYENSKYNFAYWEKDGVYYYPEDEVLLSEDSVYTAVWQSSNSDSNTWDGSTDTLWQGSGTENDPYLITSPEELAGLAEKVNESSKNTYEGCFFKQTADIYLNDINDYSNTLLAENIWEPIGNSNRYFKGNYDGGGFKISGMYIKGNGNLLNSTFYCGLFGYAENATFKNLTIDNSYISFIGENPYNNSVCVGGIVGCGSSVIFENCHNYAILFAPVDYSFIGGMVGYVYKDFKAHDCSNTGNINGRYVLGGIVGRISLSYDNVDFVELKNCQNYGKIVSNYYKNGYAGGIVGDSGNASYYNIHIDKCENFGEISVDSANGFAGGIAGHMAQYTCIVECKNHAKITSNNVAGGIAAYCYNYSSITDCENNGEIYASGDCGGIAGNRYADIGFCVNNADVYGNSNNVGGIIGYSDSSIYNCTNNANVYGYNHTGGIAGYSSQSYTVVSCTNNGNITATATTGSRGSYVGGIVGDGNATNCSNTGNIDATGSYVGGITGEGNATNCSNTGNIDADKGSVGGVTGDGDATGCSNYGNVNSGGSNTGGVCGYGKAVKCSNFGNVSTDSSYVGGITGDGDAEICYNYGEVASTKYYVGGITGDGNAVNCYNAANVYGKDSVGGITGYGSVTTSYNIGNVTAETGTVGALTGSKYSGTVTNSYYLDSCSVTTNDSYDFVLKGTSVDSATLSSGTLEGFDFETIWTVGVTENYIYPTLTGNVHEVTYKVTFLDADGVTVLKEQNVRKGYSAYPPTVEVKVDNNSVYALDHWDGEYKNITKDTTVKAVYKKTDIIKFLGNESEITVPFGYSKDNLLVDIESAYIRLLMITTHNYKMMCNVEWDMSNYNPNASGQYIITGHLAITDSPYYKMDDDAQVKIVVTVEEGDTSIFDESHLTYTVNADDTITITGYSGEAENIRIPSEIDGHKVSAIGDNAFINNTTLVTLYIPNTVKSIGKNAFKGNEALVQVTFSEGLVSVGEYAFADTALTNVTLPATLETIGTYAFGAYNGENIVNGFVIYAYADSAAVTYANETGIACVSISVKSDENTGITVTAEDTVKLAVSQVVGGDYFDTADSISQGSNDVTLFEIKLVDDSSEETQPGNMMTISVPVPDGFDGENCKIYRINADGSYKDMQAELIDGRLVFNTAHLSYYAIVNEVDTSVIIGDIDGNGTVLASDLALLKLYLAGSMTEISDAADCDNNGKIEASDLALLKLYLAGAITEF